LLDKRFDLKVGCVIMFTGFQKFFTRRSVLNAPRLDCSDSCQPRRFLFLLTNCRRIDCQKNRGSGRVGKIKAVKTVRITIKVASGDDFAIAAGQENHRPHLVRETYSLQEMTAVQAEEDRQKKAAKCSLAARAAMRAEEDRAGERLRYELC
jgi:hypothetical protein